MNKCITIKSPPFSREDLGGLFTSCENAFKSANGFSNSSRGATCQ